MFEHYIKELSLWEYKNESLNIKIELDNSDNP